MRVRRNAVSFAEAIKTCFRKYASFRGRAGRAEYWWFFLFTIIALPLLAIALPLLAAIPYAGFISLALLPPFLAATARRLHDANRTGWWLLLLAGGPAGIILGIYVGGIIGAALGGGLAAVITGALLGLMAGGFLGVIAGFLVLPFLIKPGDPGPNRYGPDPLPMPPEMRGQDYTNPGQPYAPSYNVAPPAPPFQPGGRQYCPQCGAERTAADAPLCATCGNAF